jgi:hypothetical protein
VVGEKKERQKEKKRPAENNFISIKNNIYKITI